MVLRLSRESAIRMSPLKCPPARHDEERVSIIAPLAPPEPARPAHDLGVTDPPPSMGAWLRDHLARRRCPVIISLLMLVIGMAFMFQWNPLFHHQNSWATPGDVWGIFRGAHYVGWGYLGGIYTPGAGIVTFPGMPILLAPVAF